MTRRSVLFSTLHAKALDWRGGPWLEGVPTLAPALAYLPSVGLDIPTSTKKTTMIADETLSVLYEITQTSEDSRNRFALATDAAIRPELKTLFHILFIDRSVAVAELHGLLHCLRSESGHPDIATRVNVRRQREHSRGDASMAILDDVDHSEQDASATYAKALTIELPLCIRSAVQRQYADTLRNHDLIRGLRNSYRTYRAGSSA